MRSRALLNSLKFVEGRWPSTSDSAPWEFWPTYGWLVTTSCAMIVSYALNLPMASAFLLLAVVHSSFAGGWKTGIASATLASIYSSIFLSIPDELFHYSEHEFLALLGSGVAFYGTVALVIILKHRDRLVYREETGYISAETLARESDRLFRSMADQTPVLLWTADTTGRRVYFNRLWLDFRGRTLDQEDGDGWQDGIHPDDESAVLARYIAAVKSMDRFEAEYRLRSADGSYRWLHEYAAPRTGPDGQYTGYIGACADRTERKRVEAALHQLSARLLELQDDERGRISRELHDTTAQNLAVLSMNLCTIREVPNLGTNATKAVEESLSLAERCSQEIRTLSYLLHPPLLDELGLESALRSYATGFTKRTGISVDLKMAEIGRLPKDLEITLFRIAQEALTNVHRHSGSSSADVRIIRDPQTVKVQVSDQGSGMPASTLELISDGATLGVGIAGMRERAGQLGGQLKISSSEAGTTITAILPLKERR